MLDNKILGWKILLKVYYIEKKWNFNPINRALETRMVFKLDYIHMHPQDPIKSHEFTPYMARDNEVPTTYCTIVTCFCTGCQLATRSQ